MSPSGYGRPKTQLRQQSADCPAPVPVEKPSQRTQSPPTTLGFRETYHKLSRNETYDGDSPPPTTTSRGYEKATIHRTAELPSANTDGDRIEHHTSRVQIPSLRLGEQPPSADTNGFANLRRDETINLLVLGLTGVGKSAFITQLIHSENRRSSPRARVGHSMVSCTTDVSEYSCNVHGRRYHLIDTPGFDDTYRSDVEVLKIIAKFLEDRYRSGRRIHGIIFLHRIIDVRLSASAIRMAGIVKNLCGKDFYPYVALVTNMWQLLPDSAVGNRREDDLLRHPKFWLDFADRSAINYRYRNTRLSAEKILGDMTITAEAHSRIPALRIQLEMSERAGLVSNTAAGDFLEGELLREKQRHEKEVLVLQDEIRKAKGELDFDSAELLAQSLAAKRSHMRRNAQDFGDLWDSKHDVPAAEGIA